MEPVIVARDLYKCYPGFPPVLRGVNIEVQPGEMVAIMGPSGCGKSTMLHVLGMLHAPDSGSLEIMGQDVLSLNNEGTAAFRRGNMGFVMQASNLFEHSTVFENVEFPLIYENVPPQERWERVIRALDLVRLSARVHYRSNRLSGGEQQRVAIARAMVNNPRILLADEPTGALDARTSRVIMENFRNLCHKGGVAMVMVTHDPKMAEYCDSIYTLEDGVLKCQKHDPPTLELTAEQSFLEPPRPKVAGALVAWRFPPNHEPGILELCRRMHHLQLLGRIYALTSNSVLAGPGNYSLPLPVRHMSAWAKLRSFFRTGISAYPLKEIPGPAANIARKTRKASAGASAKLLAEWIRQDGTRFLYAAGSRDVAATCGAAAELCAIPFAFAVRPEEITHIGPEMTKRAQEAAFITCSTPALAEAFHKAVPELDASKLFVLPALPLFTNLDEELEPGMPPMPDAPMEILVLPDVADQTGFRSFLAAMSGLRKMNLRVRIGTDKSLAIRWKLFKAGISKKCILFQPTPDRLAETFRETEIFIALPPRGRGAELAMPWQLTEAMSLGRAIVATAITPGFAAVLQPNENCLLAETAQAIRDAFNKLVQNPELRTGLGKKARSSLTSYLNTETVSAELSARVETAVGMRTIL